MRDINRIANALERIADALTDGKTSSATSSETVEVEPEVIASTPLTEVLTPAAYRAKLDAALEELQAQVRSGLLAYHKRGGDAEGLILETINEPLKSNEMSREQCVMMLNNKEVQ
jgi:hypothetical protein